MPITSTAATPAQRAWLEQYERTTTFEPIHQEELDNGEMTFAQVARANIDWFESWADDTHLAIQKNNPADQDWLDNLDKSLSPPSA
ncbi:hypothetical protein HX878_21090 [Pseudomonas veronii]|uniref:hypothetical protein n=1 Tax=Pseudomonas veronii TaxID=76761 RepID=UPI0015A2353D|nr:hypothetical protein [Pseudomonas veronii]NWD57228.1 hypothetical protein [Pseudomonas veronii]